MIAIRRFDTFFTSPAVSKRGRRPSEGGRSWTVLAVLPFCARHPSSHYQSSFSSASVVLLSVAVILPKGHGLAIEISNRTGVNSRRNRRHVGNMRNCGMDGGCCHSSSSQSVSGLSTWNTRQHTSVRFGLTSSHTRKGISGNAQCHRESVEITKCGKCGGSNRIASLSMVE